MRPNRGKTICLEKFTFNSSVMITEIKMSVALSRSRIHFIGQRRMLWVLLVAAILAFFLTSVPDRAEQLMSICRLSFNCAGTQLTLIEVDALRELGVTLHQYAYYVLSLEIVFAVGFFLMAISILWNKPKDWIAVFTALTLLTFGISIFPTMLAQKQTLYVTNLLQFISSATILIFAYLFPDGRFVPNWTKILVIPWLAWLFIHNLLPDSRLNIARESLLIELLIALGFYSSGLFTQAYRYKRISTPLQQQQTKWVIFGFAIAFLGFAIHWIVFLLLPSRQGQELTHVLAMMISNAFYALTVLAIPMTIAFSIQQYRLWEIDPIMNRSLVYGILSIVLALIYAGSVILLQNLFRALTAQDSQLAIVGSTLATAALFSPLRRRIQNTIDMRFYRQKYTADQILNQFNQILKSEMDLATLSDQLEHVVDVAFQPKSVTLWLNPETNHTYSKQEK